MNSVPEPATKWDSAYHAPVLAREVVRILAGESPTSATSRHILDCTLGGGGHSLALLQAGVESVVALDRDPEAIRTGRERLHPFELAGRFRAVLSNYADITDPSVDEARFDGILLDLGVSSHQIDAEGRGFTFREGAPLDMRMGPDAPITAADWLNTAGEGELASVFREYADEPRAMRVAREVTRRRANRPFVISDDLVGAIRGALGPRTGPSDFARFFQAVRIAVNDELEGLARALPTLRDRLVPGGVLAVIAYHSGEDRLVKNAFRDWSVSCTCPPKQPMCTCRGRSLGITLTKRAMMASDEEIGTNTRARSARLRAWQSEA